MTASSESPIDETSSQISSDSTDSCLTTPDPTIMAGFWGELLASEIYLLEQWNASSSESPIAQRDRLFRDYVQMGVAGRWVSAHFIYMLEEILLTFQRYHQAAESGDYERPTVDQITLLEGVRTVEQRATAMLVARGHHRAWLRIDYEAEWQPDPRRNPMDEHTEDVLARATSNNHTKVDFLFLNDRDLYAYKDWHELLTCIPEVLDSHMGPKMPWQYRQKINEVKTKAMNDCQMSSEDMHEYIRADGHWAWVTGILWVHDKKTTQSGDINLIWMDEYGRAVREARLGSELALCFDFPSPDMRNAWWTMAKEGEKYEGGQWPETSVDALYSGDILARSYLQN